MVVGICIFAPVYLLNVDYLNNVCLRTAPSNCTPTAQQPSQISAYVVLAGMCLYVSSISDTWFRARQVGLICIMVVSVEILIECV